VGGWVRVRQTARVTGNVLANEQPLICDGWSASSVGHELFIPSSSSLHLDRCHQPAGLAELARKYNVHIQSHISECCGEVACVRHLHPEYKSDAHVFDTCGLLDSGRQVGTIRLSATKCGWLQASAPCQCLLPLQRAVCWYGCQQTHAGHHAELGH
jgi:hypothetical protein